MPDERPHPNATIPTGLDRWIEIATDGLVEEARQRIDTEVRNHVAALMENEGLTEEEAIARQGSPEKAAKRYKDSYPSEKALELYFGGLGILDKFFILFFVVFALFIGGASFTEDPWGGIVLFALGLLFATAIYTRSYFVRRSFKKYGVRGVIHIQRSATFAYIVFISITTLWGIFEQLLGQEPNASYGPLYWPVFFVLCVGSSYFYYRDTVKRISRIDKETVARLQKDLDP